MKRQKNFFLVILMIIGIVGINADEAWLADAERADAYFYQEDYNAAWLFYERALAHGCNNGLVLFRAATSLQCQQIMEEPDYVSDLFAVSHYYLTKQYPDDPSIAQAEQHFTPDTIVNGRFLKQVYRRAGGKAPREPILSGKAGIAAGIVSRGKNYFSQSIGNFVHVYTLIQTEGFRAAAAWCRPRLWELLLAWFMLNLLTGIILPVVMAIAVSKEGRKSYVTAYALLLHWGLLGLHRFYLKRWKSGLLWLLSGGLLGVGIFFDLFLTGAYIRFWNEDNKGKRKLIPVKSRRG